MSPEVKLHPLHAADGIFLGCVGLWVALASSSIPFQDWRLASPGLFFLLLTLAHWLWLRALPLDANHQLLACLLTASAQIVGGELLLGAGSLLSASALRTTNLIVVLLLLVHYPLRGRRLAAIGEPRPIRMPSPIGLLFGALALVVYGAILWLKALVPPYDWDSLTYHLLDVLTFAQSRGLKLSPVPHIQAFFPKVGELLTLWVYLLGGEDKAAFATMNAVQIPYAFMGGLAVRCLAQTLELRRGQGLIVPLYVLTPLVMIQSLTTMVDVISAAFFLAALAFLAAHLRSRRGADLHLFALAYGLVMGCKFSFLYLALPLFPVFFFGVDRRAFPLSDHLRSILPRAGSLILCFALGGGFWMARNLLTTGNPIYPVGVKLGAVSLLKGPVTIEHSTIREKWFVDSKWQWLAYPFRESIESHPEKRSEQGFRPQYSVSNGFGPQFAFGLVCTLLALRRARRANRPLHFWTLMVLPESIFLWLFLNPFAEPRYILAVCGVAILGFLYLVGDSGRLAGWLLQSAAMVAVLFAVAAAGGQLVPYQKRILTPPRVSGPAAVETYLPLVLGHMGEGLLWVADNVREKTIAFTIGELGALLYGWDHTNRLFFIATSEMQQFKNSSRATTYGAWRRLLHEQGADYVFFWVPYYDPTFVYPAKDWIRGHPNDFAVVRTWGEDVVLYRPVFSDTERARFATGPPTLTEGLASLTLEELSSPSAWHIEYQQATDLAIGLAETGIRYSWSFHGAEGAYGEIAAGLESSDWSHAKGLEIDLSSGAAPDRLIVYLKNSDPTEHARFPVRLAALREGANTLKLDLAKPEKASSGFTLADVRTIHLVVDDDSTQRIGDGQIVLREFRLTRDAPE